MSQRPDDNHRKNLEHFNGPNPDNDQWFARLGLSEQERMNRFVDAANVAYADAVKNGVPERYVCSSDAERRLCCPWMMCQIP